jgi:hypothetical protein
MVFEFIKPLVVIDTFTNKFGAQFHIKLDLVSFTLMIAPNKIK